MVAIKLALLICKAQRRPTFCDLVRRSRILSLLSYFAMPLRADSRPAWLVALDVRFGGG